MVTYAWHRVERPWKETRMRTVVSASALLAGLGAVLAAVGCASTAGAQGAAPGGPERDPAVMRVPVVFSGGHETNLRDHGRPVVLVAGALGVPAQVFRDAFSHVRPAPAG